MCAAANATMTIPSRSAPPVPVSSSSSARRSGTNHNNPTSNYAIMSAWSSQSNAASGSSHNDAPSAGAVRKKPPPPRPPLPQALAGASTSQSSRQQPTKGAASLTNIFRRMKTNDNRSKDLFSLPPPPKAGSGGGSTGGTSHKPPAPSQPYNREPSVELISFDSPPHSPTPTQMSISSWNSSLSFSSDLAASSSQPSHNTTAGAGSSNWTAHSSSSTTTHSESGFEDDFSSQATFDPFSPVRTMPSYGFTASTVYGATSSTAAASKSNSKFWSPEFLDPLCNGESLLPPEPAVSMPTIIRPVIKTTATATAKATAAASASEQRAQLQKHSKDAKQQQRNENNYAKTASREGLAVVIYQFDALQDGDLNLSPDQKVILLRQINDDWFYGRNEQGQEGMLPTSYVDVKIPPPSADTNSSSQPPQQPAPTIAPEPDRNTGRPARALFTFNAQTADDLTIVEDEPISVLHTINDDWWYGATSDGRQGQFPAAYVELL